MTKIITYDINIGVSVDQTIERGGEIQVSPLVDPAAFTSAPSRSEVILLMVEAAAFIIFGVVLGAIASQWYISVIATVVGGFLIWAGVVQYQRVIKGRRRA